MESIEAIELRLWSYIDGDCNDAEKQDIAALIATDPVWKKKYADLLAVHGGLQQMEVEHTSMRFTKNVMEAIGEVKVAKATNSYINPWAIRSVIGFSIVLIVGLVGYLLSKVEWTASTPKERFDYGSIFNNNFVLCIVLLNAILLVAVVDTLFRRKKHTKVS